jgi:hypothetical protein
MGGFSDGLACAGSEGVSLFDHPAGTKTRGLLSNRARSPMPEPSKRSIEQYYAEFAEADRLTSGRGQLEFEAHQKNFATVLAPATNHRS